MPVDPNNISDTSGALQAFYGTFGGGGLTVASYIMLQKMGLIKNGGSQKPVEDKLDKLIELSESHKEQTERMLSLMQTQATHLAVLEDRGKRV